MQLQYIMHPALFGFPLFQKLLESLLLPFIVMLRAVVPEYLDNDEKHNKYNNRSAPLFIFAAFLRSIPISYEI